MSDVQGAEFRVLLQGFPFHGLGSFFKDLFIFDRQRERERQRRRRREKQAPCQKPDVGLDLRTPGSRPGPNAGAKPLSHPGIPPFSNFLRGIFRFHIKVVVLDISPYISNGFIKKSFVCCFHFHNVAYM